jgi:hypothetical protein
LAEYDGLQEVVHFVEGAVELNGGGVIGVVDVPELKSFDDLEEG